MKITYYYDIKVTIFEKKIVRKKYDITIIGSKVKKFQKKEAIIAKKSINYFSNVTVLII
jgi:hypothetical protein